MLPSGTHTWHMARDKDRRQADEHEAVVAELCEQIGRLQMELAWPKKELFDSIDFKRECAEPDHPWLSVRRQCDLLDLNRSSWYYEARGESAENLALIWYHIEQTARPMWREQMKARLDVDLAKVDLVERIAWERLNSTEPSETHETVKKALLESGSKPRVASSRWCTTCRGPAPWPDWRWSSVASTTGRRSTATMQETI